MTTPKESAGSLSDELEAMRRFVAAFDGNPPMSEAARVWVIDRLLSGWFGDEWHIKTASWHCRNTSKPEVRGGR